jgi:hypothetical protein
LSQFGSCPNFASARGSITRAMREYFGNGAAAQCCRTQARTLRREALFTPDPGGRQAREARRC